MAWGVKYRLAYEDRLNKVIQHDFLIENWTGGITMLDGYDIGCVRFDNPNSNVQWTHNAVCPSAVEYDLMEMVDNTYPELCSKDKAAWVKSYEIQGSSQQLIWQGWTTAGSYITKYNIGPKKVTITAIDGLGFLRKNRFTMVGDEEPGFFALWSCLNKCFEAIGLGADLYESFELYDYRMNMAAPAWDEFILDSYRFYDRNDETYCALYDMLEMILTSWGARIYQRNGCWYMDHISQQKQGIINYKHYNSDFVYQGTVEENRIIDITGPNGTPIMVPIEMSLHRELVRPYTEFTVKSDYDLVKNIIRYPKDSTRYTVLGNKIQYQFNDSHLVMQYAGYKPKIHGLRYSLGFIDFDRVPDEMFKFSVSGMLKGRFRVKLYIVNDSNGVSYYYNGPYDVAGPDYPLSGRWLPLASGNDNGLNDLFWVDHVNEKTEMKEFSGNVSVYREGKTYAGQLYLLICPPYDYSGASVDIDLDALSLTYLECTKTENTVTSELSADVTNEGEQSLEMYSIPYYMRKMRDAHGSIREGQVSYLNAQLVYPGLFYYDDGFRYRPCGKSFKMLSVGGLVKNLEDILLESIVAHYGLLRWKLTGTLYGKLQYGDLLRYKDKMYMITQMTYDSRRCQPEVTVVEIVKVTGLLELESSAGYVQLESSGGEGGFIEI